MIIKSSSIGMESARTYTSVRTDASKLSFREAKERLENGFSTFTGQEPGDEGMTADEESGESLDALIDRLSSVRRARQNALSLKQEGDAIERIKTLCINYLLRLLFNGRIDKDDTLSTAALNSSYGGAYNTAGYLVREDIESSYSESEETTFVSTGKVITASGEEISFNLGLTMSRSFRESYVSSTTALAAALVDPLVINLNSDITSISDQKFYFDLDLDGEDEEISMLSGNSGFLALDKNGDGIINDGSELFGTKSGDGFRDLAAYDQDGNGWIDDADDVFSKLKVFTFDEDGNRRLLNLKEQGVGAIYLGSEGSEFSFKNLETNETNARVRRTGIYLYENGTAGTIQHIDMAAKAYSA